MSSSLLVAILILDLAFGDPRGWPHPIVWIGRLIASLEELLREKIKQLRLAGVLLVLLTLLVTAAASGLLLQWHSALGWPG